MRGEREDTFAAMKLLVLGLGTSWGNCVEMGKGSEGLLCS